MFSFLSSNDKRLQFPVTKNTDYLRQMIFSLSFVFQDTRVQGIGWGSYHHCHGVCACPLPSWGPLRRREGVKMRCCLHRLLRRREPTLRGDPRPGPRQCLCLELLSHVLSASSVPLAGDPFYPSASMTFHDLPCPQPQLLAPNVWHQSS